MKTTITRRPDVPRAETSMTTSRRHAVWVTLAMFTVIGVGGDAVAERQVPQGEFFIISSVDPAKQQVLVKLPTEVTQVMRVDAQTKYVDRNGRAIGLSDLRAGDTVFIMSRLTDGTAFEIRKGPMTISELQRRYLQSKK
jgi:hypothetical protein